MNKLEKDFLIAWALGMVLPALILGLFLVSTGNHKADELVTTGVSQ